MQLAFSRQWQAGAYYVVTSGAPFESTLKELVPVEGHRRWEVRREGLAGLSVYQIQGKTPVLAEKAM